MPREDTQDAHFTPEKNKKRRLSPNRTSAGERCRELQRAQEVHDVLLLLRLQAIESVDDLGSLRANLPWGAIAGMQFDGGHDVAGAAVMQEEDPLARAPQRPSTKFVALRHALVDAVGQSRTHVMKREVRKRVELHLVQ